MTDFLGSPYPIVKTPLGYLATQSGVNQIKADLLALLMTNQGDRTMLPQYGANLRQFLFEPADSILISQVRAQIIQQINLWEPRVVINNITIQVKPASNYLNPHDSLTEQNSILYIGIGFFDPETIKEVQQLELEVPLS